MSVAVSGKHRCLSCGGSAAVRARFCPSCGAPLQGVARLLGGARALLAGGFLAAAGVVGPLALSVVLDGHGMRATPAVDWYAMHLLIVVAWLDLLFVALGAALAARDLSRAGFIGRLFAAAGVGGLGVGCHLAAVQLFPDMLSVAHMAGMGGAALAGATIGVPVIRWAVRFAPFSWASKLCRGRLPALRFANAVLVFMIWILLLPWFVVWLFATSTGVSLLGGLLDRIKVTVQPAPAADEQVAS